jgi:uncharacterized DUF497 family protein
MITFEWHGPKARLNIQKHGVSFDEAKTVFLDENAVEIFDREVAGEDRYVMFGRSSKGRVLAVCFCLRDWDSVIWIISARRATAGESAEYRGIL